jgi:hypothetical protein
LALVSHVGKVLAKILEKRLEEFATRTKLLQENQCGFRRGRGVIDQLALVRALEAMGLKNHVPLYWCFVDLKKAFDSIPRELLFQVLKKVGVPPHYLKVLTALYTDTEAQVKIGGTRSRSFGIQAGVRQGCVLSPLLFIIFLGEVMKVVDKETAAELTAAGLGCAGVPIQVEDFIGIIQGFQESRTFVHTFFYADDGAMVDTDPVRMERRVHVMARVLKEFGLNLNTTKTELMASKLGSEAAINNIRVDGKTLPVVPSFQYLGSRLRRDGDITGELRKRICMAQDQFNKLEKKVFHNRNLSLKARGTLLRTLIISIVTFACTTWPLAKRHYKQLDGCLYRWTQSIYQGKSWGQIWKDGSEIPAALNWEELLEKFNMPAMETQIRSQRLRWIGKVTEMSESRIQKQMLFGTIDKEFLGITRGNTSRLTLTQCWMKDMEEFEMEGPIGFSFCSYSTEGDGLSKWNKQVKLQGEAFQEKWVAKKQEERLKRKEAEDMRIYEWAMSSIAADNAN